MMKKTKKKIRTNKTKTLLILKLIESKRGTKGKIINCSTGEML